MFPMLSLHDAGSHAQKCFGSIAAAGEWLVLKIGGWARPSSATEFKNVCTFGHRAKLGPILKGLPK